MLFATVSGSFHRHLHAISSAVADLTALGVKVLSPADPRIVDSMSDDFLFVASDRVRSVRLVQDRHIESIRASDFLWLVDPDGYVGQSASMEVGFAVASDVPIVGEFLPSDLTLRQYVQQVRSIRDAVRLMSRRPRRRPNSFLIEPHASIEEAHNLLAQIDQNMAWPKNLDPKTSESVIRQAASRLRNVFDFAA